MSKRSTANKSINKANNNITNNNNNQLNSNYNVIINQNSTFNQDNSINIMLDGNFPYFQNYNYQANEKDKSNQIYQYYQPINSTPNQNNAQNNKSNNNSNNKNKAILKKKNCQSPKNLKNNSTNKKNDQKCEKSPRRKTNDDIEAYEMNQRSTNKIDYRYVKKCPIKDMISTYKNEEDNIINDKDKENQLFWFATYGKLMKTKHLLKIFNYYNNKPFEHSNNNYSNQNLISHSFV